MSTFVALDFGERRVGVAIGETESQLVTPLDTLERRSDQALIRDLLAVADQHDATTFVLGLPCRLDGTEGEMASRVRSFQTKLESRSQRPTQLVCETLTTREARQRIQSSGGRSQTRRRRLPPHQQLDAVSAQIIGEQYLAEGAVNEEQRDKA